MSAPSTPLQVGDLAKERLPDGKAPITSIARNDHHVRNDMNSDSDEEAEPAVDLSAMISIQERDGEFTKRWSFDSGDGENEDVWNLPRDIINNSSYDHGGVPDFFYDPGMSVNRRPLPPPPLHENDYSQWPNTIPKPWVQDNALNNLRSLSTKTDASYATAYTTPRGISNASMASKASYFSAASRSGSLARPSTQFYTSKAEADPGPTRKYLEAIGILPKPEEALDWSGRGQHVVYDRTEKDLIPLIVEKTIGYSATALVESVRCRRIRLARKKIRCNRHTKPNDAISEVKHLQSLRHFHLVRIVGSYMMGQELSILMYPVTEWNLEEFMDDTVYQMTDVKDFAESYEHRTRTLALRTFFGCLSNAIHYIHSMNIKHMDIKPKNLLVRIIETPVPDRLDMFKVYIADFGIARSYSSPQEAETDSRTSFTRMYAAPEVIQQEPRGFSADIFSLGCVFTEMLGTVLSTPDRNLRAELEVERGINEDGDSSFSANISAIKMWLSKIDRQAFLNDPRYERLRKTNTSFLDKMVWMLDEARVMRPSAEDVVSVTQDFQCLKCDMGLEQFEAANFSY